ncbi:MAG: GGDEF domain-containing protein [Erysipelotrichaceae bacterium]
MIESNYIYKQTFEKLVNNVPGGLAIYRIGETFETLYFNDGVCFLTNHTREEYLKIIQHDAMDIVFQEDRILLQNEIKNAISEHREINISYRIINKNMKPVWVHLSGNLKEVEGEGLLIFAIFMDISDERKIQDLLSERAERDSLTGLLNRIGFENRINNDLSKHKIEDCAFIMLDIDNFKTINDDFGHLSGDYTLCKVANILTHIFSEHSYVSRMGGDEFAVFINHIGSLDLLNSKIEHFYQTISDEHNKDIKSMLLKCSLGIALSPKDGYVFQDLYANADKALFYAKRNGKNQYHYFSKGMEHVGPSLLSNMEWLLDETSNGVYITNSETYELLYVNNVTKALCGIKGDEYLGKKCYSQLLGKDHPCEICKLSKMSYDYFYEREYTLEKPLRYLILKGKLFNWNGIVAHVEFLTDNTQGALITKEYEKTANRLQSLMDFIPGGIGIFEVENKKIQVPYLNDGFFKLIHFPITEKNRFIGNFNRDIVHSEDINDFYNELYAAIDENREMNITFRIKNTSNGYQWLNMQAIIVKQLESKTTLYCSFSNANSLKDSELKAKLQKEKFDIALNNTDICIWEYNIKEKLAIQSNNSLKIYPFGEIIHNLPESIIEKGYISEESIEDYRELYRRIDRGIKKSVADIHWIGFGKNNDWWARITYSLIYDDMNQPIIAMGATTDITNEKMAIRRYNEELDNRQLITPSTIVSFKMNLSNNKIEESIINDNKLAYFNDIKSIDVLFSEVQRTMVSATDIEKAKILNRSILLQKYSQQQTHLETEYRRYFGNGYIRFLHVNINLMKHPETGDIMAFIYTTDYTETKVIESAIRNFVKYYYDYIMFINGIQGKYKIFDKKEQLNYYQGMSEGSYYDYFASYVEHMKSDEEKEKFMEKIKLENIYNELESKDTYELAITQLSEQGELVPKELRYSYIDKESKKILLAQFNLNRKNTQ